MYIKKLLTLFTFVLVFATGGCANFASDLVEGSKQAAKDAVKESMDETKQEITGSVKSTTKDSIRKAKRGAVDGVKDAAKKVAENAKVIIWIDARSEKEFASGHLKVEAPAELYNIPHTKMVEKIGDITSNKNDTIYLYCKSGRRSGIATDALKKAGYKNVYNKGALRDLVKKGYSTTR